MTTLLEQRVPARKALETKAEPIVEARAFLFEASFVALTSILVGAGLGLVTAHNVIGDAKRTASWENLSYDVPWGTLGLIFLAVYVVAMAATFAPARRASRIYPAEALRYQ